MWLEFPQALTVTLVVIYHICATSLWKKRKVRKLELALAGRGASVSGAIWDLELACCLVIAQVMLPNQIGRVGQVMSIEATCTVNSVPAPIAV